MLSIVVSLALKLNRRRRAVCYLRMVKFEVCTIMLALPESFVEVLKHRGNLLGAIWPTALSEDH